MKWLIILLIAAVPCAGIYLMYIAYRIHFKADYSRIGGFGGEAPQNPDIYAPSIAKAHFIGGALIFISIFFITKFSLFDIIKFSAVVGAVVKAHNYALTKNS